MKILLSNNRKRYKANLHCHTTLSDGNHSPEEIKELYKKNGYHIVAFTDHDKFIPQNQLTDNEFLALNGVEFAINQKNIARIQNQKTYHFNALASRPSMNDYPPLPDIDYNDINAINKYLMHLSAKGFLLCYNHPWWSLQSFNDYANLDGIFAMEIYNHNCQVEDGFCGYNPQVYDEMLRQNQRIFAISADDNHNAFLPDSPYYDSFGGWVMINSESLAYEDVIKSLKLGDFYSTQGPDILYIALKEKQLTIKCSACSEIKVYTDGRTCYTAFGKNLTEVTFNIKTTHRYLRIVCRNEFGKEANSNAYFLS